MTEVLRVQDLSYWFKEGTSSLHVLKSVFLQITAGELVILSGPSGCGKTTLLTLIGGLRPFQEGSIMVCGQELFRASSTMVSRVRSEIGMIFQAHHLIGFLNARENVQLAMEAPGRQKIGFRDAQRLAEELLADMGLEHKSRSMVNQLSGGQRQRVAIARALACEPRLILADEPTASLDAHTGRHIMELLKSLAVQRGIGILMASHDQRLYALADRVIQIDDGRILD